MPLPKYIALPPTVTNFEHRYLARLNRVALYFFMLHVPVLMAVAWVAGTGVLSALLLSTVVLVGPVLALRAIQNPRGVSLVHGVTAMLMGGLLVHFGQGPMQIEMHFYFFALLAMLCMFANPMVNLVAAGTAAVHHLGVWLVLPSSVFNYEAQWWVVLVHAGFVVLETVAACYISREFFDNVIGLEKIIEARTETIREKQRDMRLILDNVETGLVTVDLHGRLSAECSRVAEEWFGPPVADSPLGAWLKPGDSSFADWMELSFDSVREGMLPPEVALCQLPRQFKVGDSTYALAYQLIAADAPPVPDPDRRSQQRQASAADASDGAAAQRGKILVIVTDITERLLAEATGRHQAELLHLFQQITRDKAGFIEFLDEAGGLVAALRDGQVSDSAELKRLVHTLKGNAAIFGMNQVAEACHELESQMAESGGGPEAQVLAHLFEAWDHIRGDLQQMLGEQGDGSIEFNDVEYEALLQAVLAGTPRQDVADMLRALRFEPSAKRLARAAQQLTTLADRLGKPSPRVVVQTNGLRLDRAHFQPFWSEFIHVLRNTVDHGIEDSDARQFAGKPEQATLQLITTADDQHLTVVVQDDGPGIDWARLKAKAEEQGLAVGDNPADVEALLFASGVSAKQEVTELSGRGVGMGAVRDACHALGGRVEVYSQPGRGTRFSFILPRRGKVHQSPGTGADLRPAAAAIV